MPVWPTVRAAAPGPWLEGLSHPPLQVLTGLTSTCPEREAAFATDVVKTLSAEEPTLATVTVVTSAAERPAQRRVGGTHLTTTRTPISSAHCAAQTVLGQHPGRELPAQGHASSRGSKLSCGRTA